MSHDIDDYYKVYRETLRVAAKDHTCDACAERIAKGTQYFTIAFVGSEHNAETVKRCARCQKIHKHLRTLNPGETWPAERLDCGETYQQHWECDPPEEIAALAFALPGEVTP